MGIYQRDNINYGGMLGNAMANRMAYAQRDADIQRQMGQNWANAINQGAQGIAAGLNTWNQQRIDQDKLAQQQQFQAEQKTQEWANALERAREQQKWQAEQNELQRASTEKIAMMNANKGNATDVALNRARNQMNYDMAQAEYNDALAKVDMSKPETIAAAQKAAIKLNYNAEQLPYYNRDLFNVSTEFTEDAPMVARNKAITSAKAIMDPILKLKPNKWSDEQREQYTAAYNKLLELDPDAAKAYEIALVNMGRTTGDNTRARVNYIQQLNSGTIKFDPNNKYRIKEEIYRDPTTGKWAKRYK